MQKARISIILQIRPFWQIHFMKYKFLHRQPLLLIIEKNAEIPPSYPGRWNNANFINAHPVKSLTCNEVLVRRHKKDRFSFPMQVCFMYYRHVLQLKLIIEAKVKQSESVASERVQPMDQFHDSFNFFPPNDPYILQTKVNKNQMYSKIHQGLKKKQKH